MIRYYLALLLLATPLLAHTLNKVMVQDPDALCLDGSKPAYYIHEGNPHKFVLSFQGGGWCGSAQASINATIQNCYQRSKGPLGSSKSYAPTLSATEGILSDSQHNPYRDWTIVFFMYCDGTGHQGFKKDPVEYNGTKLWFRGHNSTKAKLDSVDQKYKIFSEATHIIVTGQSAGGLATFSWTTHISNKAPKTAKVWSVPDSGIFLDQGNYLSKQHNYRTIIQNFMKLSNSEVDPPVRQCVDDNPKQIWKCMFAEYIHPYIKVPLFPINSLYDSWSLPNILGISCGSGGSLAGCNQGQMQVIQEYKQNTTSVLKDITKNQANGCWAPACSDHVYNTGVHFYSTSFEVPQHSDNMLSLCMDNWLNGKSGSHVHIDTVSWPNNRPCSGVKLIREN